jgi:hypothetical protein
MTNFVYPLQVNQNVEEESRMYGDILLENFNESYNNLTIKSLMMLKFISISEVKSELIFKVGIVSPLFGVTYF